VVGEMEQVQSYQVLDVQGRVLAQGRAAAQSSFDIPVNQLAPGVYNLVVFGKDIRQSIRFVRQ
jgi:hypothetical protein